MSMFKANEVAFQYGFASEFEMAVAFEGKDSVLYKEMSDLHILQFVQFLDSMSAMFNGCKFGQHRLPNGVLNKLVGGF